jgi:hypothetical protein
MELREYYIREMRTAIQLHTKILLFLYLSKYKDENIKSSCFVWYDIAFSF